MIEAATTEDSAISFIDAMRKAPTQEQANALWDRLDAEVKAMVKRAVDAVECDKVPDLGMNWKHQLLAEAKELLRNATYADGHMTALTQDAEALAAAIAKAEGGAS